MTSSSRELPLNRNMNTNHMTKTNDFTSYQDNLNYELKLGSFQTKTTIVTVPAPAYRVKGPSQYGGPPREEWRPPVNAFLTNISSTASAPVDQIEMLSHSVDLSQAFLKDEDVSSTASKPVVIEKLSHSADFSSLYCRDLQSAIRYSIQVSIWANGPDYVLPPIQCDAAGPAWRV